MTDSTLSVERGVPELTPTECLIDFAIVFAVSGLAFFLEDIAIARGWIPFGAEVRGATSMVAGAIAAICVVLTRGGTFSDLGFRRPERWKLVPLQVAGVLGAFIAVQLLAPLLVSSFISLPEPDLSRYDSIGGNPGAAIAMVLILPLTASIPEEIIFRGFLIGRLTEILGRNIAGSAIAVSVQALVFGAFHFQWGVGGVILTVMMGVVWGIAYMLCGRNLWIVILAHSTGHILFVFQLYLAKPVAF
ncbi:MAG: type II CAAX endopeptidase family protein [Pseudomonadales bacterium]